MRGCTQKIMAGKKLQMVLASSLKYYVLSAPEITQERSVVIMTTQFKIWMIRVGIWVVIKFVEQFIIFRENSSS